MLLSGRLRRLEATASYKNETFEAVNVNGSVKQWRADVEAQVACKEQTCQITLGSMNLDGFGLLQSRHRCDVLYSLRASSQMFDASFPFPRCVELLQNTDKRTC